MLCKSTKVPLKADDNWIVEQKYDGIRAIMTVRDNEYWIETRTGQDITRRFPELRPNHGLLTTYILDGEIVTFDEAGRTDFQQLQSRIQRDNDILEYAEMYPAFYVVFDCLMVDGIDTMQSPLLYRKGVINNFVTTHISESGWQYADGVNVRELEAIGYEGVVYKLVNSLYLPGKRGPDWQKYKFTKKEVVWAVGFTHGVGKREGYFGALIVADFIDGKYKYKGTVGTGYTDLDLIELSNSFELVTTQADRDLLCKQLTNVPFKPFQVHVEYLELTNAGIMRMPAYKGRA